MEKTVKAFREDQKDKFKQTSEMVDKHFSDLCRIAADLKSVSFEPFRINTPFGFFSFTADAPFIYSKDE